MVLSLKTVRQALSLPQFDEQKINTVRELMMPVPMRQERSLAAASSNARVGSVLILFYQKQAETHLVFIRRRADLRTHAGQIAFPGGGQEGDESLVETALRETEEEIGIPRTAVEILGELSPTYIPPSNYIVYPFVGWYKNEDPANGDPQFRRAPDEVAEILEIPVSLLLAESIRQEEPRQLRDLSLSVPYFAVAEHKIWGATAFILSEMVERLRYVTVANETA
jgi:8-oxo-dGTP pyrophosphatase MutT (NUDIX family)